MDETSSLLFPPLVLKFYLRSNTNFKYSVSLHCCHHTASAFGLEKVLGIHSRDFRKFGSSTMIICSFIWCNFIDEFLILVRHVTMQIGSIGHRYQMKNLHDLNITICGFVKPTQSAYKTNGSFITLSSERMVAQIF